MQTKATQSHSVSSKERYSTSCPQLTRYLKQNIFCDIIRHCPADEIAPSYLTACYALTQFVLSPTKVERCTSLQLEVWVGRYQASLSSGSSTYLISPNEWSQSSKSYFKSITEGQKGLKMKVNNSRPLKYNLYSICTLQSLSACVHVQAHVLPYTGKFSCHFILTNFMNNNFAQ